MKHLLTLIALIWAVGVQVAFCQQDSFSETPKSAWGVSIGYSRYSIEGNQIYETGVRYDTKYKNKNYVTVGLHTRKYLSKRFFFGGDLSFIRRGGEASSRFIVNNPKIDDIVLQTALIGGIQAKLKKGTASFLFGPAINQAIIPIDTFDGSDWYNDTFSNNTTTISGLVGLELTHILPSGKSIFGILKYDHDFTPRIARTWEEDEYILQSKGFTLSIGYRFSKYK